MKFFIGYLSALFLAAALVITPGCATTEKSQTAGEYVDDSVISSKINALLLNEPGLTAREINVDTHDGVVQLSGFVSRRIESEKAASIARSVRGVKSVINDIRLKK
jgi:osmotically-inducible protein OsmY